MEKNFLPRFFLIFLVLLVVYGCYLIYKPFLSIMIFAAVLVSVFQRPYEWLTAKLKNRRPLASLLMCLIIILLVIVPLANFLVFFAQQSVEAYSSATQNIDFGKADTILDSEMLAKFNYIGLNSASLKTFLVDLAKKFSGWLVGGTTIFVRETTNFIFSVGLLIITMYFFFIDGEAIMKKIMRWTPLPNKYDREIFQKFRDVSSSILVSSFLVAIAQGLVGAIGFLIVGLPVFLAAAAIAFFSLLPYVGATIIWGGASLYLLAVGKIWQGIFLAIWGAVVIANIDNFIRAYFIKGKAQVQPIFLIFSILGGIALFGFWGVFFGPLIISLAVTIMHIYELEYEDILEK